MKNTSFLFILCVLLAFACGEGNNDGDTNPDPVDISIMGLSTAEGSEYGTISLQLTLSAPAPAAITANISTTDGTADSASDYVSADGSAVSFASGESSKTLEITINGDNVFEEDENFQVNIASVTGPANIDVGTATVTLTNDDVDEAVTVSIVPEMDWTDIMNLAPGSDVSYDQFNFGQPANISNEDFTSVGRIGDYIFLEPQMNSNGDTLLYSSLWFEDPSTAINYLYLDYDAYVDSFHSYIAMEIIEDDPPAPPQKYWFYFSIGTDQGRFGPYRVDPKIRVNGQ